MNKPIFCLMGPTATGKTGLAMELCQRFNLEIISVDSAMIYQGMDIGTAKPSKTELLQTPHHLVDILNPMQTYSVAEFYQETNQLIQKIHQSSKYPLLVGGTMMYFNALQQGLSKLPGANLEIRNRIIEQAMTLGWPALHQSLQKLDYNAAQKIHPNDSQRIQRALEVCHTGLHRFSKHLENKNSCPYTWINLILFPKDRFWLHKRINHRLEQMVQQGLLIELVELLKKWPLSMDKPAMRCVGYRQGLNYLTKNINYDAFIEQSKAATRQLAKRQITWLRRWSNEDYICPQENFHLQKIIAKIDKVLDNL